MPNRLARAPNVLPLSIEDIAFINAPIGCIPGIKDRTVPTGPNQLGSVPEAST